jgi:acetyl esterase/lipase
MNPRGTAGRLLVGLSVIFLLGACATGASLTPAPATPTPTSVPSVAIATPTPAPTATAPATPAPTPSVVATYDVAYESANPVLIPGELDVYAPTKVGPWPVVVMFHGAPGSDPATDRGYESENARRVADLGVVVFNASWGHRPGGMPAGPGGQWLQANNAQGACAVEFARSNASKYGGDPSTMIVFGHSGGAHIAATAAFARPKPTAGCLGGTALGAIDALVTWEGNWILSVNEPDWDGALAADPRVFDAVTPWKYLAGHKDQKVVMLVSENPGASFEREVGDPWAADSWLGVRDPSGDLRRQLKVNGAFADGTLDFTEVQQLLFSVLKAQGNPVSLDVMPGSSHTSLSDAGWKVFLAAFPKAAAKD